MFSLAQRNTCFFNKLSNLSFSLVFLLSFQLAHATSGLEFQVKPPVYSTGRNRSDFVDMRLQTLAGEIVIRRLWTGKRWVINTDWNDLLLVRNDDLRLPSEINLLTAAQITNMTQGTGLPKYILRNGEVFPATSLQPESAYYRHIFNRSIKPEFDPDTKAITGYLWRNLRGKQIHYNAQGQIDWLQEPGKSKIHFTRNAAGNIVTLKDANDQTLLTFAYQSIPAAEKTDFDRSDERLLSITDYSGRAVQYSYAVGTGRLTQITDVRGKAWAMHYNDKLFTGFSDPDGRKTTVNISIDGVFNGYKNADGVGDKYEYNYDKNTEQFSIRKISSSGEVTERRYNQLSDLVFTSTNGQINRQQQKAVLSTGETTLLTAKLVTKYRRVWVSGGGPRIAAFNPDACIPQDSSTETDTTTTSGAASLPAGATLGLEECQTQQFERTYIKQRSFKDERGLITTYYYNQFKEITKIVYPDKTSVQYSYAPVNPFARRKVAETDIYGTRTEYSYDDQGNLTEQKDAVGTALERRMTHTYNAHGLRETTIYHGTSGTADATWRWEYDANGNVHKAFDPYQHATIYSNYDALGNAQTITDANGHVWPSTYDAKGDTLTRHNPYGQGMSYGYDNTGYLTSTQSSAGDSYNFVVNSQGLPKEIRDSLNHLSKINYDLANRPTQLQDAANNVQRFNYDGRGRISRYIDGENNQTDYEYQAGLLAKVKYPTFQEHYSYDSGNRINRIQHTAENIDYLRRFGYNIPERTDIVTDANGNDSRTIRDQLGRIVTLIDNQGGSTHFTYDNRDNLLQVTDPEGRTTTYTYNLRDQVLSETKALQLNTTEQQRYQYDNVGNFIRHTNANGQVQHYRYDNADRLIDITSFNTQAQADAYHAQTPQGTPVKTTTFTYNNKNQLAGYNDGNSSETRTYTVRGRLQSVTVNFGSFSKTYQYTYTPNGLIKSYTSPEGQQYQYSYNKNNQISHVTITGKGVVSWSNYQWLQATTITLPGGNKIHYQHDGLQRQTQRIINDSAGNRITQVDTQYDAENNIDNITRTTPQLGGDNIDTHNYGYDKNYRLTSTHTPLEHTQYQYDGVGNRTQERNISQTLDAQGNTQQTQQDTGANYNANNQLTDYGQAHYSYDANGNTTERIDIHDGQLRKTLYHYNTQQRLIKVDSGLDNSTPAATLATQTAQQLKTLADNATITTSTVAQYRYNAYNQRIQKTANGSTTYYLYSEQGLAAEYDANGQLIVEYHYKPQSTWMTNPISQHRAGQYYYYLTDHLGTPQRLIKTNGSTVWQAGYKAFGEASINTDTTTVENNLRFPGQYYDQETGSHYNYYRDYDPETGRYLQSDPIGLRGGMNTYAYANNNPTSFIDPLGLTALTYNQTTGNLTVDPQNGTAPYTIPASSGRDGSKNQKTPDKGPIPTGNYTGNVSDLTNPGFFGDLARNTQGDWGDWRMPLIPDAGTETFGRDGFFLHGGRGDGSAGCIDIGGGITGNDMTDKLLKDILNDPDGKIPLTVVP